MRHSRSARLMLAGLLASTAMISPAQAQSVPAPELFREIDSNGVDLVTGMYSQSFTEGKIGSGEGAVSIVESNIGPDQWTGLLYRTTIGGVATMVVQLGTIADTFTQSGSTWVATKANGATLVTTGNAGEWKYTSAEGTAIVYDSIAHDGIGGFGAPYQVAGPDCTNVSADAGTCAIPMSIIHPNGMNFHYNWNFSFKCDPAGSFPCQNATAYYRFNGITSSANYGFGFTYTTDDAGGFSAPVSD
jgi:hypothetical protein